MPHGDDEARRAARARSQARMEQVGHGQRSLRTGDQSRMRHERQRTSSDQRDRATRQYGQSGSHPSQRQSSARSRTNRQSAQTAPSRRRAAIAAGSGRQTARSSGSQQGRSQRQPARQTPSSPIQALLSNSIVGIGIAAFVVIIILVLAFAVFAPSCSGTAPQAQSTEAPAAPSRSLVQMVADRKATAQTAIEAVSQVDSLESSDMKVEALVSLLGEDEASKLIAQAKTNADALWIAAHSDEYAFDGVEVQYKILKLAADEPAAVPYVHDFPAKYPMADAVADRALAMDVASPADDVPTTPIPHLYQWDRRWAYTIYSSATFGLTGCGPTSFAMVYQGLNKTADRTPHDMAVLAEERGFMSEFNGTDSAFYMAVSPELGLNCWEEYPDAENIVSELSRGNVIIANLGPGYFTANGHFFVLAGLADNGQVIVNDPYSVVRSSQTWDPEFIAAETIAMFVFSK